MFSIPDSFCGQSLGKNMLDTNNLIEKCVTAFTALSDDSRRYPCAAIQLEVGIEAPVLPPGDMEHIYWNRPDDGYSAIGVGQFFYRTASGPERFEVLQQNYQQHCRQWRTPPGAFLAFAFDAEAVMTNDWSGFPNALLCVPRLLLERQHGRQTLRINLQTDTGLDSQLNEIRGLLQQLAAAGNVVAGADNDHHCAQDEASGKVRWLEIAARAITAIRQNHFSKLVVGRRHVCEVESEADAGLLLSRLIERYPSCTIISYRQAGRTLIAATPERLLSLHAGHLQSDAIGGTLSDVELRQCSYMLSPGSPQADKLLQEHGIIVKEICSRLEPVCQTLTLPTAPQLKKLHKIYHLETPISGRLDSSQTALALVDKLHPTPAIAGFPSADSVRWLAANEEYERGWYGGACGWVNGDQTAEISVMLRCALLSRRQIIVYAGAGLVADSDVETEWQETELKMKTILDIL